MKTYPLTKNDAIQILQDYKQGIEDGKNNIVTNGSKSQYYYGGYDEGQRIFAAVMISLEQDI